MGAQPKIGDYLQAGYPCLFMRTAEPHVVEQEVRKAMLEMEMSDVALGIWKISTGFLVGRADGTIKPQQTKDDLIDALAEIEVCKKEEPIVGIFHNVRQMIGNNSVIQQVIDSTMSARLKGCHLIFVGPHLELPVELKNLITVVDCPLPTSKEIAESFTKLVEAYEDVMDLPEDKEERKKLLREASVAAVGLDSLGAENALSLSMAMHEEINIRTIQKQKEDEVRKSDVLEFVDTEESMQNVGGFDVFKEWLNRRRKVFTEEAREYGLPYPKGMLIVGPAGCLAESTVLPFRRGKRNSGRKVTIADAYHKFHSIARDSGRKGTQYLWSRAIPTLTLCEDEHGVIHYAEIADIVDSGVKTTYTVITKGGNILRTTLDHEFRVMDDGTCEFVKTDSEYAKLKTLAVGDSVMVRDNAKGKGRTVYTKKRKIIENVPFHPFAWDHWVSFLSYGDFVERNYKRINYARLVIEAELNNISIVKLIQILREFPEKAAKLKYLDSSLVVHHKDFKEFNDARGNLEALLKVDHDRLHGEYNRKNLRFATLVEDTIVSIEKYGKEHTYDIIMTEPNRNFLAHGFAVHNSGKSLTAKASAGFLKLPLLRLDMGKVFRSLVGESEAAIRMALQVVEAVSPCVLWIDEIEKGMAGMSGSGNLDSGVTARVVSTILTWRQETTSPVVLVATANEIASIPSTVYRKGRLDEVWATDLPTVMEREEIFAIHIRKRERDESDYDLPLLAQKTEAFVGSEIEVLIEDAMFKAFDEGIEFTTGHILTAIVDTVPQSQRDKEELEAIRQWAQDRARMVSSVQEKVIHKTKGKVRKLVPHKKKT